MSREVAALIRDVRAIRRRLTQAAQLRKCSRSPLHRAAASPLQQPRRLSGLSALKMFLGSVRPGILRIHCHLEGEVETAAKHSKIIFNSIDHTEAQVVSPTDMPRESDFETGSELTDHFGFATEVIRLRVDSERIWRPLCVKDISFAAAENCTDTSPCVGRKTRAGDWI